MSGKKRSYTVEDFYFLKVKNLWHHFWSEHPAFWFICGYLFIEYFRPQSIYPVIDILPWAKLFLLGSIALSFVDKKSKGTWSSLHFWVFAFFIQLNISILFAYNSWWSDFYYINGMQWAIVIIAIVRIVVTRERLYIFTMVLFLCSLKLSIGTSLVWAKRGFAFANWGIKGPPGFFENSGELAIQMLIAFSLAYYLYQAKKDSFSKVEQLVIYLAIVTPVITILGASSRGAQLALVILLIIIAGTRILKLKYFAFFVIISISIWTILPQEQKDRLQDMGSDNTSEQRLLYWERGFEMIVDHPIMGVGYYNFIPYFSDNYPNDILFVNQRGQRVAELPHNILIQVGTDAGLPALVFYLIIIFISIRASTNKTDIVMYNIDKGISIGVIGFFIAGQFVSIAYYPFLWIAVAFKMCLIVINNDQKKLAKKMKIDKR
ncbi:O-antigen ligase family protein [Saccharospirillum sp.]|uniref:O-antigen ligase family protein n=1 Tax=Saccharospirillum sp. TaxID=2033801 RepID=UPI00329A15BA